VLVGKRDAVARDAVGAVTSRKPSKVPSLYVGRLVLCVASTVIVGAVMLPPPTETLTCGWC
jgi:hypothetical protein